MHIEKEVLEKEFRDELRVAFDAFMENRKGKCCSWGGSEVKFLRQETDAPIIFCRFALEESRNNLDRAVEIAREYNNLGINWTR